MERLTLFGAQPVKQRVGRDGRQRTITRPILRESPGIVSRAARSCDPRAGEHARPQRRSNAENAANSRLTLCPPRIPHPRIVCCATAYLMNPPVDEPVHGRSVPPRDGASPGVVTIAPHPDDVIGAAAVLIRVPQQCRIVRVTDGAPCDMRNAQDSVHGGRTPARARVEFFQRSRTWASRVPCATSSASTTRRQRSSRPAGYVWGVHVAGLM